MSLSRSRVSSCEYLLVVVSVWRFGFVVSPKIRHQNLLPYVSTPRVLSLNVYVGACLSDRAWSLPTWSDGAWSDGAWCVADVAHRRLRMSR